MFRVVVLILGVALFTGCDRVGVARVEIVNPQGFNMSASAVEVDPAVQVSKNEIRRTHGGMDVDQRLEIHGWVRIVPATGPLNAASGHVAGKTATQPAGQVQDDAVQTW